MTSTIHHVLRGDWHSSEAAFQRLRARLVRKGAGPGVTLRFSGRLPHGAADAITLVDLTYLVGADAVVLPVMRAEVRRHWMPVLRARAARWGVQIVAHGKVWGPFFRPGGAAQRGTRNATVQGGK